MGRAPCCDKNIVKRGPWSPEEDAVLKSYIDKHGHGGNWIALPQKAGLNRCGKSCRLRWLNYLRPNIKHGGFTQQEDTTICCLYEKLGSRWSIIASHLPGRTDNDVKNYWNTKLKKKLMAMKQQAEFSTDQTNLLHSGHIMQNSSPAPPLPPLRVSGIKAEVFSHVEEFSKPLQSNYVISNGPYSYYSEGLRYSMMSLLENRKVVSPPLSEEISAASSSVTVDNGTSINSFINWNSSDNAFFSEFSDLFSGYGDAAQGLVYSSAAYS